MKPLVSMWSAVSDRDYADQREPREPERQVTRTACRCGADMTEGSAIGHLSHQSICLECAKAEGAEYLRRRAAAIAKGAA